MSTIVITVIILVVIFVPTIIVSVNEGQKEKEKEIARIAHKNKVIEDLTNKIKELQELHIKWQDECTSLLLKKQECEEELEQIYDQIDKAQEQYRKIIDKTYQSLKARNKKQ